jgi:hypothetical protein
MRWPWQPRRLRAAACPDCRSRVLARIGRGDTVFHLEGGGVEAEPSAFVLMCLRCGTNFLAAEGEDARMAWNAPQRPPLAPQASHNADLLGERVKSLAGDPDLRRPPLQP